MNSIMCWVTRLSVDSEGALVKESQGCFGIQQWPGTFATESLFLIIQTNRGAKALD